MFLVLWAIADACPPLAENFEPMALSKFVPDRKQSLEPCILLCRESSGLTIASYTPDDLINGGDDGEGKDADQEADRENEERFDQGGDILDR